MRGGTLDEPLSERVWTAHGDAWQAEGRVRASLGGGALELPGVRLMSSGLPHAQWNNGDVTDTTRFPLEEVRSWYAARASGHGVPWGVCVPAGQEFRHGRRLFRKRCMGLGRSAFACAGAPDRVRIRAGLVDDTQTVVDVDAAAFGSAVEEVRPWIQPHLGAPGFTVAIAEIDGSPVGIGTSILTDDRAGRAVGIFGIAVLKEARRRGIGRAITSWLLERAFAHGAGIAHLNPDSDAAARVYARLGFVETAGLDVYVDL